MSSTKNILLVALLISTIYSTFASQSPTQRMYAWLKSWFITPQQPTSFKKAVAASGKSLDLFAFYKQKEDKQSAPTYSKAKSLTDPKDAADTFKKAVKNNTIVMERLQNDPNNFFFGASSSSYQYEGGLDSNNANAIFYQSRGLEPAGIAIDFWNRYEKDIFQMKDELGINCFRLSIAWDRVQLAPELWNTPDEPLWNENAIAQYVKIIKLLKKHIIEPIVVLHHYTIPQWFAEIGGFEKKENIKYFVEFAKKIYEALHEDVTYWSTFNAIEGYAFKGYHQLDGPPGIKEKQGLIQTQKVMVNMLEAHVQVYQAIKGPDGLFNKMVSQKNNIPKPLIGIQKNIALLDPDPHSHLFTRKKTELLMWIGGNPAQNKGFFDFFKTGTFYIPHFITHTNIQATSSLDWIGVNIYSNMYMVGSTRQQEQEIDRKTANLNYRDYPEGIYRAVKIINDNIAYLRNIPIIITENGIATDNDDEGDIKRARFFRRALYMIRKLIEENYPIIGYTPWASHDNYEWPSKTQPNPYDRPYGVFKVNFDKNSSDYLKRTLKKGAEYYRDFIKTYFEKK